MTEIATLERRRISGAVSLSVRALGPLLKYITACGHDSTAFLTKQGVDPLLMRDLEARLPQAVASRLWLAAGDLTQDLNLGIHVAEGIQAGDFGALSYAVRTSATMGIGLQRLCRYHRVLHDFAEVKLTIKNEHAILSHYLPIPGGLRGRFRSMLWRAGWLLRGKQQE